MMQPMMGQPMMRPPFTGAAGAAPGAPVTAPSNFGYQQCCVFLRTINNNKRYVDKPLDF